ncbi:hypothetical protein RE476_10850 [Methanolobus mangrovi]|uniref:DUF5658 domain-containing protein n=1 Tax=Methanolobus mangrovi TaxID=3072977 RepID=A0AA51UEV0_9EURY|nr:hypothetical protein [Methanolobus mangrovi]WMW21861.1 hypothetical protein RE476_10850 [Methanolobus mangrovi]
MHNANQYVSQFANIPDFLKDVKYIILFYVLGDFLTTAQALNYGFEENNFLAMVFQNYGVESLLVLKAFFLFIVYWNYRILRESDSKWTDLLWVVSRKSIAIVGLFLVVNNLMVIFMECSLLQVIHTMTF